MTQLQPFFRIVPVLLFVFGILITAANVWELRATSSPAALGGSFYGAERTLYLAALVRSFYDLVFLWGMAALVTASNKYLEGKDDNHALS